MVSVVICSKYTKQFLKCVKSIAQTATSGDYEIVVKVDSPEDESHRKSILSDCYKSI